MGSLKVGVVVAGLLTIVAMSGCGKPQVNEQSKSSALKKSALPALKMSQEGLLGNWTAPCHANAKFDNYSDEYLQFDLEETNHLSTYYLDSKCSQILYQQNVKSSYSVSYFNQYSETPKQVAITPESTIAMIGFMSDKGFCQKLDWQINVEKTLNEVKICGIQVSQFSLRGNEHKQELLMKECPESSTECYTTVFSRRALR